MSMELLLPRAKVLWNFRPREQKFHKGWDLFLGAKVTVTGIECWVNNGRYAKRFDGDSVELSYRIAVEIILIYHIIYRSETVFDIS